METTIIYAIAAGGAFISFILIRICHFLAPLHSSVLNFVAKHLTYPYFVSRHQHLGPWSRAGFLAQVIFALINIFCLLWSAPS